MSTGNFIAAVVFSILIGYSWAKTDPIGSDLGAGGDNETVFFCRKPPAKTAPAPTVSIPKTFSVAIEAVYFINGSKPRVSDLIQSWDETKQISAVSRFEDGISYQYIFNDTSKTFMFVNGAAICTDGLAFNPFPPVNGSQNDPLLYPHRNVSSIMDVWKWAINSADKELYKDEDEKPKHEHGIPIDHYYVCKKDAGDYVIEIEICVTQKDVQLPFPGINGSLPVRIDIKRYYNGTSTGNVSTVEEFIGYQLSGYKAISDYDRETAFLPPPGVFCNTSGQSRPPLPSLPTAFSVAAEYVDDQDRKIAISQLHVDLDEHYLALQYSQNVTGLSINGHADVPRGRIVHDFKSGIEYVIDAPSDTCINVNDLPSEAGDADLDDSAKRQIIMKNASELLGLHLDNATGFFYYVGERYLDREVLADVWVTYKEETEGGKQPRTSIIVHEAYFSKPDWKSYTGTGASPSPILLALKIYEWLEVDEARTLVSKKTVHYHGFTKYDNVKSPRTLPWKLYDVTPCLNVSKNDSFLVAYGNDSLANVEKAGRGRVEIALRQSIADAAKVSPLRVTNFYFESVNETVWIFFFISDRPKVNGSQTKWHAENPITAKEARANLNASIGANAMTVPVKNEDGTVAYTIALSKGSLSAVPPYFAPPTIQTVVKGGGYTGGSMAALGICMLLIGGVLGMALAFFMWKRNRAGGGAPVYYSNKSSA